MLSAGLVLLAAVSAVGPNLLYNADFAATDNLGAALGWSADRPSDRYFVSSVVTRPRADGVAEVGMAGPRWLMLQQRALTLRPGGRYRLSCEVETAGGNVGAFRLSLRNGEWTASLKTGLFPDDTRGGWQAVSLEGVAPPSRRTNDYVFAISGEPKGGVLNCRARLRRLALVALDAESVRVSRGCPTGGFSPLPVRIVPIDPLLADVSARTGRMTFYFPGVPRGGVAACTLAAAVDGRKPLRMRLREDGRATVAFGALKPGEHRVRVAVEDSDGRRFAANDYRIVARAPVAKGPPGRRLNNFVTELVRQPLADGETRFYRPGDGWVWISFDGACGPDPKGFLDGSATAVVRRRAGDRRVETQRYVTAGWHTLRIAGTTGGRLRIHAVKPLVADSSELTDGRCTSRYNRPFSLRFDLISTFNTLFEAQRFYANERDRAFYRERGMDFTFENQIGGFDPRRRDRAALAKALRCKWWQEGHHLCIDENQVFTDSLSHVNFSEVAWEMNAEKPSVRLDTCLCDSTYGAYFNDPHVHASEVSAIVNSGNGRGLIWAELYPVALWNPTNQLKNLALYRRLARTVGEMVPAARGHLNLHMATYFENAVWNNYTDPSTDIKAHYGWFLHKFATEPDFADNGGLGLSGIFCGEEEIRRWMARCIRHYALEGGTEDLVARYGFPLVPGYVKNPDFASGLDGWEAAPAAGGSVAAIRERGYGEKMQGRRLEQGDAVGDVSRGMGDGLAVFTSATSGPNELRQRIAGLVPGACYSLQFTWTSGGALTNRNYSGRRRFAVRLEGADEIRELSLQPRGGNASRHQNAKRVFKARSREATLVFSDRDEDGAALEPGTRQMLNYVIFRRYYLERPEELDEVVGRYVGASASAP